MNSIFQILKEKNYNKMDEAKFESLSKLQLKNFVKRLIRENAKLKKANKIK